MPKLAALGGSPVRKKPFADWPMYSDSAIEAAYNVLRKRKLKYHPGGTVSEFEKAFGSFCNAQFVVCVFNGTISLEIAMRSVGVVSDSEVIIPAYDHPANINSVINIGAKPRFADVDYDRPNISPRCVAKLINQKTRAIVVTHMVGLADVDAFERISKEYDIPVIYDCARVIGSEWKGQQLGKFGTISSFSFEESKLINAGEGGALATNDPQVAERIYAYRNRGRDKDGRLMSKGIIGSNYRMTEFQAACLKPQLSDVDILIHQRVEAVDQLRKLLLNVQGIRIPTFDKRCTKVTHYLVNLRYDRTHFNNLELDLMVRYLRAEGIPCNTEWLLPYRYAQKVGIPMQPQSPCLTAEKVHSETLVLRESVLHSNKKDLEDIITALKKIQDWSKENH